MSERKHLDKHVILMRTERQREYLLRQIAMMPLYEDQPYRVTIDDPLPQKSRDQEALYHALIGDIARQWKFCDRLWSAEDLKRLLLDQFRRDTAADPDAAPLWGAMGYQPMAPAIDGSGVVVLGVQSRRFPAKLAGMFIEFLYAFGTGVGVKFTNEKGSSDHANE